MQVLTLLAWCHVEAGEAEHALSSLAALRELMAATEGESSSPAAAAAHHYVHAFLSLRALLLAGRCGRLTGWLHVV